jgi:hypothetical protein
MDYYSKFCTEELFELLEAAQRELGVVFDPRRRSEVRFAELVPIERELEARGIQFR